MKKFFAVFLALLVSTAAIGAVGSNLDSVTVGGYLYPKATDIALGSSTQKWAAWLNSINGYSIGSLLLPSGGTTTDYLRGDNSWRTLNTGAVTESSNLYFTSARARAAVNVTGSSLGYDATNGLFSCILATGSTSGCLSSTDWSTFNNKEPAITASTTAKYWRGDKTFQTLDTLAVTENTNLYYTDARARAALSASLPIRYNSTTGAFTIDEGNSSVSGVLSTTAQRINGVKSFEDMITMKMLGATPSAPGTGDMGYYFKTDGKLYKQNAAGTETEVGSGTGAGAFNIATLDTAGNSWAVTKQTNSDAETTVGDWAAYADAAATTPVDMSGGSPNTTCTRNTSSPIDGTGDFKMTISSGATRQGEGCSLLVNLPTAYRGRPLRVYAPYTTTGTISSGDIVPYAYDVSGSSLLAPSATISGVSGSSGMLYFTLAPGATTAQFRTGLHVARASNTGAVTVNWDDFKIEPDLAQANVPVSDWQSYTPTFTGLGTAASVDFYWRRVGDSLEIQGIWTTGTPTATEARISLPTGLVPDATKVASLKAVGNWYFGNTSSSAPYAGVVNITTPNSYVTFGYRDNSTHAFNQALGSTAFGSSTKYGLMATIPISGWSSGGGTSPILSLSDWVDNTSIFTINNFAQSNAKIATRRVGDTLLVRGQFTGGSASASTASIDISGYKIDTSKIGGSTSATKMIGTWVVKTGSSNIFSGDRAGIVFFDGSDTDSVFFAYQVSGNDFTKNNASQLVSSGHIFEFEFAIPVSGWTSTSSGTLTAPRDYFNLDTGNGLGSTDTYTRRFTNTNASIGSGFTISDSSTLGTKITIVTAGNWCFNYSDTRTSGTGVYGISVNDSALTTGIYSMTYAQGRRQTATTSSANAPIHVGWCGYLNAGDVVRAKVNDTSSQSTSAYTEFSGARMSN